MKSNITRILLKLLPYDAQNLQKIRLGRNARGGFVVSKKAVLSCDVFLSIGTGLDLTFEAQLLSLNKRPLICVDPCLKDVTLPVVKPTDVLIEPKAVFNSNINAAIVRYRGLKKIQKWVVQTLFDLFPNRMLLYFSRLLTFMKIDGINTLERDLLKEQVRTITNDWELTTINDLIDKYKLHNKNIGLILNIDGVEQEAFEGISEHNLACVQFLVLSLHGLHREDIQRSVIHTINAIRQHFTLVHVHPVNDSKLCAEGDITFTSNMECTFVHNSLITKKELQTEAINSKLDRASNVLLPEVHCNYLEKLNDIAVWGDYSFFTHSEYFASTKSTENAVPAKKSKQEPNTTLPFVRSLVLTIPLFIQGINTRVAKIRSTRTREKRMQTKDVVLNNHTNGDAVSAITGNTTGVLRLQFYMSWIASMLPNSAIFKYHNVNLALVQTMEELFQRKTLTTVVAQGCGTLTLIIAFLLKNQGSGKLICIEHDRKRAEVVTSALRDVKLNAYVEVKLIDLKARIYDNLLWLWYDVAPTHITRNIDLLLVSNTTEHIQLYSTYMAIPTLHANITSNTSILVHGFLHSQKAIVWEFITKWRSVLEAKNVDIDSSLAVFE